jgi:hypothetical protein
MSNCNPLAERGISMPRMRSVFRCPAGIAGRFLDRDMSTKNDGGSAFPITDPFLLKPANETEMMRLARGMSLRDWVASKAMAAMLTRTVNGDWPEHKNVAKHAYDMADEMLRARGE